MSRKPFFDQKYKDEESNYHNNKDGENLHNDKSGGEHHTNKNNNKRHTNNEQHEYAENYHTFGKLVDSKNNGPVVRFKGMDHKTTIFLKNGRKFMGSLSGYRYPGQDNIISQNLVTDGKVYRTPYNNKGSNWYGNCKYGKYKVLGYWIPKNSPLKTKVKRTKSSFDATKRGPKKRHSSVNGGILFNNNKEEEHHTSKSS